MSFAIEAVRIANELQEDNHPQADETWRQRYRELSAFASQAMADIQVELNLIKDLNDEDGAIEVVEAIEANREVNARPIMLPFVPEPGVSVTEIEVSERLQPGLPSDVEGVFTHEPAARAAWLNAANDSGRAQPMRRSMVTRSRVQTANDTPPSSQLSSQ